jgi:hypothetical protein
MKIALLCDHADRDSAASVLKYLKTVDVAASAWAVRSNWRRDDRRLDELIASATHLVAVYTEDSAEAGWLAFLAGYARGADRPLALYRPDTARPPAGFLADFSLLTSLENLAAFVETERQEWTMVTGRREARRELLDLGVSFRGDAFADSVKEGNVHAVDLFLRAGLPADTRDRRGVPILCLAARGGNRSMVATLVAAGADIDAQAEDRGNTALMDAAGVGAVDVVEDLVAAGAHLDLVSKDGQSALVIVVGKNDAETAAALLAAGADPDLPDKLGLSARKYAALFHNAAMKELFEKYPAPGA